MTDRSPAQPSVEESRGGRPRVSPIWLIPIVALAISLGVAWNSYNQRGPLIEIEFESAEGITPAETKLKFKNFDVGTVEEVHFTDDLSKVVVGVRVDKDVGEYIDSDAEFWLVSARVGPQGVTGLSTVISGAYIEGSWDAQVGERQTVFTALPRAPLTPPDTPGQRVSLRAPNGGSVTVGGPILYKQIEVGTIEEVELTDAGDVRVSGFIEAPHDQYLTTYTRFWNASGFSIDLSTAGASLRVDSLISLIRGGIAFETVNSGGEPIGENHVYQLYASERAARSNLITEQEGGAAPLELAAIFEGSVNGLDAGADVRYHGIKVGEVIGIEARVVERPDGPGVDLETRFTISPNRIGVTGKGDEAEAEALEIVRSGVERGLRAKLTRAGLISPALFIDLVADPDEGAAELEMREDGPPLVPAVPPEESDLMGSAQGLVDEVTSLPIKEVMDNINALIGNVNALISNEEFRSAPTNIGEMIAELRDSDIIDNVNASVESFREISEQLAAVQLADQLKGLVTESESLVRQINTVSEGLPELLTSFRDVADKAADLPLDSLMASATDLVNSTNELVASSGIQQLPPRVEEILTEIEGTIADFRASGIIENADATMLSFRDLAEEVVAAQLTDQIDRLVVEAEDMVQNISTASADLPQLMASLRQVSDEAASLPLQDLVASADELVKTANGFIAESGMSDLPPRLAGTLREIEGTLAELRAGGTVENVNATLASASEAAQAIEQAAQQLPALVTRLDQAVAQASSTVASVGPNSNVNRELTALLSEARAASRAVESLARELERRPNSVIFGR